MSFSKVINPKSTHLTLTLSLSLMILLVALIQPAFSATQSFNSGNASTAVSSSEQAYHLFHLTLAEEQVNGPDDEQSTVVFKDGTIQPEWIPVSPNETINEKLLLFHHGQYADRISFEFSFGSFLDYDIRTPSCTCSDFKLAKPKITDFQLDLEEQAGSFTVIYDCQTTGTHTEHRDIIVSVLFPVVSGLSLFYSFRKTCGGGLHDFVELGYFEGPSHGRTDSVRVAFNHGKHLMIAGPHLMSTRLYIHLYPPAISQEFFHAKIKSSSEGLAISTRGPIFGGVLKKLQSAIIHVLYECNASGVFNISVNIPIHPFNALRASWKKDCGGGLPTGLSVGTGTSSSHTNDIVDHAVTVDQWRLALQTTRTQASGDIPTMNASTRMAQFWLSNDGMPVHVASPIITVEDPTTLAVMSTKSNHEGTTIPVQNQGNLLVSGSKVLVKLRMVCLKKGVSSIIVTFPVRSFSNVEFGFLKECKTPQIHVHSTFLRTANSLMVTLSFCMTGAFVYWWIPKFRAAAHAALPKSATLKAREH